MEIVRNEGVGKGWAGKWLKVDLSYKVWKVTSSSSIRKQGMVFASFCLVLSWSCGVVWSYQIWSYQVWSGLVWSDDRKNSPRPRSVRGLWKLGAHLVSCKINPCKKVASSRK